MKHIIACASLFFAAEAFAYDFIGSPPIKWPPGAIPMALQLDATMAALPLSDGKSSWNAVAQEALDIWNSALRDVQFESRTGNDPRDGNRENEVFFSSRVSGREMGFNVLAITTVWHVRRERVEGDTIFNLNMDWDSYRGDLQAGAVDLRRVALHEFGHTLGLDHPDRAGQVYVAIMNSTVSDLETLAGDDIRGVHALYPGGGRFNLNVLTIGPGTVRLTPAPEFGGTYPAGTFVTLVPRPERRNRFLYWSRDADQTRRRLRVRMTDDLTVVANFASNTAPAIVSHPRSQFASAGKRVTFAVRIAGTAPASFQWHFNGQPLPATRATLELEAVGHQHSGDYSCRVMNSRGEVFSKPARLVVDGY
jgi:hypothetical protein